MDFFTLLIQVLNAVQYGLLLFLVAAGLTLIFGMMGIINLAHGSFYMIGAYLSFGLAPIVAQTIDGGFLVTLVVGLIFAIFLGYLLEWLFYSYLYERDHLQQVLMTYGLILVFEEVRSLLLGDDVHSVAIPAWLSASVQLGDIMTYPIYRLFISGICLLLAAAMLIVLTKTRLVFASGVAIAAFAGMIAAPVTSVYPGMGQSILIICFVVVVIGGIGSIRGALIASLLIGFVDTFGKVLLPNVAGVLVYVLMAAILLWKPSGLFKAGS